MGFTTIAEGRDAEHVRELLSLYFDLASEIIRRYGGTVEKFIGDAVMAIWGAPTAHEDDAERAVRAALDLVAAIPSLGATIGGDLQARAGVLSGEAAVTVGATNQGLVAGDLVNTASRLQSVAQPGTVLVGETTRDAAAGAIAFAPAGESLLKGKSAPVAAFRALRVVAKARGVGRSDALEPPFVGRDVEFRLVRDAFHATARDRRARLVSITGEAGVGKSRLAWEFSKYTDGLADQLFWHEGRSPAYGEGISFWALGEMARKRCGLVEADDEPTTRQRIEATLADHVPDPAERGQVEAALLALLGLAEAPPGGREPLFTGWRTFFERLASVDPVVLLFEDIQWADDGLLDFIDSLLEWSQSYPILVLTLSRPELLDRRPTWGASRNATSLPLGPLADEAMRALLAGLVPGIPDPAARTILERAGGMPLYAVETVRMLVAEGRLEAAGDGTYRATGTLDAIEVPASLHALIAARLDALPAHDRALLQDASVLGQTFSVAALGAIATDEAATLEPRLRSLVARDLLSLDTDPRSPERGQYGFVQALTREVAYSTLSMRDRRARHLAAARYFETLGDEELAGALATHYFAAYEAAAEGPEAHALAGQARIALRAAGERARALGSLEQAITFFENAGRLPGAETEQLALLETAADIGMESSRYARAEPLYREIAERASRGGRPGNGRARHRRDRGGDLPDRRGPLRGARHEGGRGLRRPRQRRPQPAGAPDVPGPGRRPARPQPRGRRHLRIDHDRRRADTGRGADPHRPSSRSVRRSPPSAGRSRGSSCSRARSGVRRRAAFPRSRTGRASTSPSCTPTTTCGAPATSRSPGSRMRRPAACGATPRPSASTRRSTTCTSGPSLRGSSGPVRCWTWGSRGSTRW